MGKITKNYIYNLLYQIFVFIVPLVTAPYLARTLGAQGTGIYGYVHSFTSLLCTVVMLGIYSYGNRLVAYVRDDSEKLDEAFWRIISARIIIALFGTIIYILIINIFGKYKFYFIIYYTYLMAYFLDCTWLYVGVEDMKWAVLKNAITKILALLGILVFVKDNGDLWKYILIQGGSVLISNIWAYSHIKKYVGKPKIIISHFWEDIRGSIYIFLPSLASTIYLQCDKVMIEWITSQTEQISFYDYSEKIVTIPLTFITVLSTVMMPRIANEFKKNNYEKISILLNKAGKLSMFIAFPMMFGLMAVSSKLIPWYLGIEFSDTIIAIIIIAPIIVTNALTGISGGQYFTATNQLNILLKIQVTAAIANIIINAILIPKIGFLGAAIATVLTGLYSAIYQYRILVRQISLPGLLRESIKYFILGFLMLIIIYIITKNMPATAMTNIIQVLIGIIWYFGCCIILKDKQLLEVLTEIKKKIYS